MLPGVSGGTILSVLEQYEHVANALNRLDWFALATFGAGGEPRLLVLPRGTLRLLGPRPRASMAPSWADDGRFPARGPGQAGLTYWRGRRCR